MIMKTNKMILIAAFLLALTAKSQTVNLITVDTDKNPLLGMDIYINDNYVGANFNEQGIKLEATQKDTIFIRSTLFEEVYIPLNAVGLKKQNMNIKVVLIPKINTVRIEKISL